MAHPRTEASAPPPPYPSLAQPLISVASTSYGTATITEAKNVKTSFFTKEKLDSISEQFKRILANSLIPAGTKANMEVLVLNEIINYMQRINADGTGIAGASLDGLFKHIDEQRDKFLTNHGKEFKDALAQALGYVKDELAGYARFAHTDLTFKRAHEKRAAKGEISAAHRQKLYDFCCITACIVYCPIEQVLTCCHCCKPFQGNCQDTVCIVTDNTKCCETTAYPYKNGNCHNFFCSPHGNISRYCDDWEKNNGKIQEVQPVAQRMI